MVFQTKAFNLGFFIGSMPMIIVNLVSYLAYRIEVKESLARNVSSTKVFIDTFSHFGFPFPVFYGNQIDFLGLVVNILIGVACCVVLGLTFGFVWSKISTDQIGLNKR